MGNVTHQIVADAVLALGMLSGLYSQQGLDERVVRALRSDALGKRRSAPAPVIRGCSRRRGRGDGRHLPHQDHPAARDVGTGARPGLDEVSNRISGCDVVLATSETPRETLHRTLSLARAKSHGRPLVIVAPGQPWAAPV
jgi:hypothetical protein